MPSPLGHALGGFVTGWLIAPEAPTPLPAFEQERATLLQRAARWHWAWLFAAAGVAADVDLLAGQHRLYTHSVGAALIVFGIALLITRRRESAAVRLSLAIAASYASHLLLDWLGVDSPAPRGILALWPFSGNHYFSQLDVFPAISRKIWTLRAWKLNLMAVATEAAILGPIALACWRLRRRRHDPPLRAPGERRNRDIAPARG